MNYSEIPFDLRLEVLASILLEAEEISPDQLLIHSEGLFLRNYKTDILSVEEGSGARGKNQLHISVAREGLYDSLPEGLFHQTIGKGPKIDTEASVEEIKRHQKEEKEARKFFMPIEQEFFRLQIEAEILERKLLLAQFDRNQYDLFLDLWRVPGYLTDDQITQLLHIVPLLHRIVGNLELTELCLSIIMGTKIQLQTKIIPLKQNFDIHLPSLGEAKLGQDTILGSFVEDSSPDIELIVGPIGKNDLKNFLTGGQDLALLQYLAAYMFPVQSEFKIVLNMEKKDRDFYLTSLDEGNGMLGYSTFI